MNKKTNNLMNACSVTKKAHPFITQVNKFIFGGNCRRDSSDTSNFIEGENYCASSNTPYSSDDQNKEAINLSYTTPFTSYVDYLKQYHALSDAKKVSVSADALSSPQRSLSPASPIVATYDYSPFGQLIATSGTPELSPIQFRSENHRRRVGDLDKRARRSLPLQEVSHRSEADEAMTNQVFDPETALTYYNHRYYNPTDGRWLSRDPAGESASLNLYAFVNNASIYRTDYLGLEKDILEFTKGKFNKKNEMVSMPTYAGIKHKLLDDFLYLYGSLASFLGADIYPYNSIFKSYLDKYLLGTGGDVSFNIPSFYMAELVDNNYRKEIFITSFINSLRSARGYIYDNEIKAGDYISFVDWESTNANSYTYIPILGKFKYGLEVSKINDCKFKFNIYLYDIFDFHIASLGFAYALTELLTYSRAFSVIGKSSGYYYWPDDLIEWTGNII